MALFTAIIVRSVPSHKESVVQKGLLTNTFMLPTLLTGPYHYSLIQFRKHTANQGKINFKFSSLSSWIDCAGGAHSAALVPPIFSLSGSFSYDQTAAGRKLPARAALLQLGKCLDIEPDPSGGKEERQIRTEACGKAYLPSCLLLHATCSYSPPQMRNWTIIAFSKLMLIK